MEKSSTGSSAPRPNYFVAIPIQDFGVVSNVKRVQERMERKSEIFKAAMIPLGKLHVTLSVMYLENEKEIKTARQILEETSELLKGKFASEPFKIRFSGIGTFGMEKPNILYAQIGEKAEVDTLKALNAHLKKRFQEELGISTDAHFQSFQSHLTIAKAAANKILQQKRIRYFPPFLLSGIENTDFGAVKVHQIQLLRMGSDDGQGGYISEGSFSFQSDPSSQQNSSVFFTIICMLVFLVWGLVGC